MLSHWFDLMSSRHAGITLNKNNIQKYDEEIAFLKQIVDVFFNISIGDGKWKPGQTGVILSTLAIISLSDELLARDLDFLLTARLTQDCLENLFSTIRLVTCSFPVRIQKLTENSYCCPVFENSFKHFLQC